MSFSIYSSFLHILYTSLAGSRLLEISDEFPLSEWILWNHFCYLKGMIYDILIYLTYDTTRYKRPFVKIFHWY